MKEVLFVCQDGVTSMQFQSETFGFVDQEPNEANITTVDAVETVECGVCPGTLVLIKKYRIL